MGLLRKKGGGMTNSATMNEFIKMKIKFTTVTCKYSRLCLRVRPKRRRDSSLPRHNGDPVSFRLSVLAGRSRTQTLPIQPYKRRSILPVPAASLQVSFPLWPSIDIPFVGVQNWCNFKKAVTLFINHSKP